MAESQRDDVENVAAEEKSAETTAARETPADLDALLEAIDANPDPEADAIVDDALDISDADEAAAAIDVLDDPDAATVLDEDGDDIATAVAEAEAEADVIDAAEQADASDAETADGEQADEAEPADVDPYEAFRKELRTLPGKWYVIHSYAGFEKRVKQNIESRKTSMGMEDFVFQVEVPMEDVVEIKNGQRKLVTRVRIPGYVLVRMFLNEDSWSVVRHTPGVTGFVGNSHNPTPLRFEEAFSMLQSLVVVADVPVAKAAGGKGGKAVSRSIPAEVDFEIGETITIKEGSFAGLPGSISEIKPESGKLTVLVSLFERETPVELSFDQVTKL
ncbi:transcription termination/antitermination protein NusG [Agreia sp. VKM Ac-1783]|uniref:transcription termination/antitermination protein NusG n=1 Tax=Agreia sp. VKM Ac-1783 TaxID=1938889 RepID=UPI000A2AB882|nr:transcription termination/antitermination protein NusG [Agreia sp. VKM Ac-1783]SMQ58707.1 transcription antitermination protein nusG [Agreia sp. VKM Ac-1783]